MFRAYLGLVRKEFIQITRDHNMMRMILAMPVLQLLLLGYAVNTDVKRLAMDVYDHDQSQQSREFVRSFASGDYYIPTQRIPAVEATALWRLDERFKAGDAEVALIIPPDFSEKLTSGEHVTVGLVTDGAAANAARAGMGYAAQIVGTFAAQRAGQTATIDVRHKFLYNPELESMYFMIPGIVATLLTMVTVMLTSMAIVREREMGTLEQLSVTPIGAKTLLFGKISTFAILGLLEMCIALIFGVLWFGIPFVGSPLLLFGLSGLYLMTTLGMGMFFSTVTSTQQQAMFFAWFFSIFAMITSGFFTPVSNMPQWLQYVTLVNPMRFFMDIVRGIMMKGSGVADLSREILALVIFGVTVFSLAALRFHKRTG